MTAAPNETARAAAAPGREGFRQAMSWVHTWAGLVLGWLLFAIFATGTLSFFKSEFNLWMRPEMHGLAAPSPDVADRAQAALHRHAPGVTQWIMRLPDERLPAVTVLWRDSANGRFQTLLMDPSTGESIGTRETMGGEFFYRFHFELRTAHQSRWALQGRWIVGVATLLMFIALLTGVVTHRRIFKDFFTFRPTKGGQRAWLDAHNVSGVLALPFYLVITFSGLMIFHTLYMPAGIAAAYATPKGTDSQAYFAEMQGDEPGARSARRARGAAEAAAPLPPLDLATMVAGAHRTWGDARIGNISARRDADGTVVEVTRHDGDRLQYGPARLRFDGATARQLALIDPQTPAIKTYRVLYGLHLARFAGPGMRWALFGFGVLGSLMIASGLVLWSVKRRAQAQRKPGDAGLPFGERLVASLNVGLMGGLPLAVAAFLAANRLLPLSTPGRADAELAWFFGTWGAGLAIGLLRPDRRGWALLLGAAGALFAALPVINAATTSAHLGITLPAGEWAWAGMDLSFLVAGLVFGALARHLLRRRAAVTPKAARAAVQPGAPSGTTPAQGA
ncbi:PepSY domain-containing protein [Acidovorax sp. NCPPB 3859]|nr:MULTISPECIES: PepSY-associated TM helix domain-containing protein [unclassified Acidovorax]MDA8451924.1 PepSY domain-containing protein [Acidovorax sp. GBBC 3297]MDA8461370.1 PepSY domain-containing protein [Acidovorax sp. GBBC 3333]MDA8466403.1 PepSY domain-containing protein [Acidovorax sp. GBBC 3332]MDA8471439.1 PepSY domain-containing protein [Acidovorax sp. GBBC 3299]WCM80069.1 PepSY domain-containing protein [Acidovorax sp. GBBC 712]